MELKYVIHMNEGFLSDDFLSDNISLSLPNCFCEYLNLS